MINIENKATNDLPWYLANLRSTHHLRLFYCISNNQNVPVSEMLISKQQHELAVRPSLTLSNTVHQQIREATYLTSSLYVEIGTITTLVVTLKTANTSPYLTCVKWPFKAFCCFFIWKKGEEKCVKIIKCSCVWQMSNGWKKSIACMFYTVLKLRLMPWIL